MNITVFVNFRGTDFETNLGVTKYIISVIQRLRERIRWIAIIDDVASIKNTEAGLRLNSLCEKVVAYDEAKMHIASLKTPAIELLIHHFKLPTLGLPSLTICHDLHVYDVPWKYKNPTVWQKKLVASVTSATTVACHFPKAYFSLERAIGKIINNLFLTPSIPLHDQIQINKEELLSLKENLKINGNSNQTALLFPSQLQEHKGHIFLIKALADGGKDLAHIDLWFPGSDHSKEYTEFLKQEVERYHLSCRIRFFGRVRERELAALYISCDSVIVPSLAEGGAYVPLEGIAYGKAVAVNSIESSELHLASMNLHVIWFDVKDTASIHDALLKISEPKTRDHLISKNKKNYTENKINEDSFNTVWNELIAFTAGVRNRPILGISSTYGFSYYG
jgi:glycosyltransferase involved in cell wall biosynthesis